MTSAEQWHQFGPGQLLLSGWGRVFCPVYTALECPWGSLMDFSIRRTVRSWLSPCISCRICPMESSQPSEMLVVNGQVAAGQILFKKYNPKKDALSAPSMPPREGS